MPSMSIGIQCEILIPLVADVDRRPHRGAVWAWWESELMKVAGGFTGPKIYKSLQPVSGSYEDPRGKLIKDDNAHYIVCLPSHHTNILRLLIEEEALARFGQNFIYLNVGGQVEYVFPSGSPVSYGGYR